MHTHIKHNTYITCTSNSCCTYAITCIHMWSVTHAHMHIHRQAHGMYEQQHCCNMWTLICVMCVCHVDVISQMFQVAGADGTDDGKQSWQVSSMVCPHVVRVHMLEVLPRAQALVPRCGMCVCCSCVVRARHAAAHARVRGRCSSTIITVKRYSHPSYIYRNSEPWESHYICRNNTRQHQTRHGRAASTSHVTAAQHRAPAQHEPAHERTPHVLVLMLLFVLDSSPIAANVCR